MPHVLRSFSCSVLYPMLTTLAMRGYLYGVTDSNFYRMALYTALPLLLFVSLDVLFRLIKMYRIGLKIVKEREMDKKEN